MPPMRWVDADAPLGCSVDPSAEDSAAGEAEDAQVAALAHSQFELVVEGCGGYGLPHYVGSQGTDVFI